MFDPQQGEEPGQLHHRPLGRPNGQIGVPFGRNSRHRDPVTRPPGAAREVVCHRRRHDQSWPRHRHLPWRPEPTNRGRLSAIPTQWTSPIWRPPDNGRVAPQGVGAQAVEPNPPRAPSGASGGQSSSEPGTAGLQTKGARASLPPMIILGEQPAGTLDLERAFAHDEAVHPASWTFQ